MNNFISKHKRVKKREREGEGVIIQFLRVFYFYLFHRIQRQKRRFFYFINSEKFNNSQFLVINLLTF